MKKGMNNFPVIKKPSQNPRHQMDDIRQVPCWGPTNIAQQNLVAKHNLAPAIFAPANNTHHNDTLARKFF